MATKKKAAKPAAKKPAKPIKKAAPAKKTAPAKKAVAKVVPKKAAQKTAKAKSAPAKKVTPAKKAAPAKKVAPTKKPVAVKKPAPAPAKKSAAPVKKVTPPPAKAPVKKEVAKKPAPTPVKAVAKPEPVKKVAAPAKPAPVAVVKPTKPSEPVKAKDIKVGPPKPVVIPKITTKTVRKYHPEFTKSVLDKTEKDMASPSLRYSDNELLEFKEIILRKLEAAKKELAYLNGLITRKDDMGGDESDNRYMTMEDGSLSMEREQLSQMASRQITFIDHLEKALVRIENKTYGICRVTGKLIDKARLRAVPHATLSMEAKTSKNTPGSSIQ